MSQIEKANQNLDSNDFFTKKRIIMLFTFTIFTIIFSIVISIFALKIDINEINNFFTKAYTNNPHFFLWIFLLFLFPIYENFSRFFTLHLRIRKDGIKAKWWDWLLFVFIGPFLNAVTPFSTGNEPYTLFWLKTKGVDTKKSLLILSSMGFFHPLIQIIITWPSFLVISMNYGEFHTDPTWLLIYWVSFLGLIFNLIAFLSFFALVYSRRVHFALNSIYYWLRKKVRMSYKTKEEIKNKYIEKATFKNEFIQEIKDYKYYTYFIIQMIVWNIIYYISIFFVYELSSLSITTGSNISFWDWFNYTNVAVTANNWVPIGGAEGTLQIAMITFLNSSIPPSAVESAKTEIVSIIFIWRLFNFYIPGMLGFICFPISAFIFIKKYKK